MSSGSINILGAKFEGSAELHEYWLRWPCKGTPKLKTIDLKSAYKQLPLLPEEVSEAIICLKCPDDGEVYGFPCLTLPFGVVASVLHFNRFARYLQRVFWHLGIMSANYFDVDDYPIVEMSQLCSCTGGTMGAVVNLLGIRVSEDKDQGFNGSADMLGVSVDVSSEGFDAVKVANRGDRVEDIDGALHRILLEGKVHVKELPALFGRLHFSEVQILGRSGKVALADLRYLERLNATTVHSDDEEKEVFQVLKQRLENDKPRTIYTSPVCRTALVFTDGAFEPAKGSDANVGSIDGVLFHWCNHAGWSCRAFGCVIFDEVISKWSKSGKRHLIGQVEMSAVVVDRVL